MQHESPHVWVDIYNLSLRPTATRFSIKQRAASRSSRDRERSSPVERRWLSLNHTDRPGGPTSNTVLTLTGQSFTFYAYLRPPEPFRRIGSITEASPEPARAFEPRRRSLGSFAEATSCLWLLLALLSVLS